MVDRVNEGPIDMLTLLLRVPSTTVCIMSFNVDHSKTYHSRKKKPYWMEGDEIFRWILL